MNKVVCISALALGSTGRIMQGIAKEAMEYDFDVEMFVSANKVPLYEKSKISNINTHCGNKISIILNKITGLEGFFVAIPTLNMLRKIEKFSPDIVHLHILHHGYINLPILFRYLKKKDIPIVWTFHDCWAFTGHCPHFSYEKCEKWKRGCFHCLRYRQYPRALYDNSKFMWKFKRKWFTELKNMTIVTPSKWLNDLLKDSYLNKFNSKVINNGIDLEIFKPVESNIKERMKIEQKKVILGVSSVWNNKKGLDVFCELSKRLSADYQIILVGTDKEVDEILPTNILSIHRTENQKELAAVYSVADVFVNPTREDNFPTVNMEALACGTPVITFETGGSAECLSSLCGSVVPCDDIDALEKEIKRVCVDKPYVREACVNRAQYFNQKQKYAEYVELYKKLCTKEI